MKIIVLVSCLLLAATAGSAQSITTYTLEIFVQGATNPMQTTVLQANQFTCGVTPKAPMPTSTVVNPSKVVIDDPSTPTTADCVYVDGGTGPLLSLPMGGTLYTAALAATNAVGTSPLSAMSNVFMRSGVPSAPTTLRIIGSGSGGVK